MHLSAMPVDVDDSPLFSFPGHIAFDAGYKAADGHFAEVCVQVEDQLVQLFVAVFLVVQVVLHDPLVLNVLSSLRVLKFVFRNGISAI